MDIKELARANIGALEARMKSICFAIDTSLEFELISPKICEDDDTFQQSKMLIHLRKNEIAAELTYWKGIAND